MKATHFNQALSQLLPIAERYARHRLELAEKRGWVKPGVYEASDLIDQALLKLYQQFLDQQIGSISKLRVKLFQLIHQELYRLIDQERPLADSLSMEQLYQQELSQLLEIERMTSDAEGEVVLLEDLDEKEYPLKEPAIWILESDLLDKLVESLELDRSSYENRAARELLAYRYVALKPRARELLDLVTLGQLTVEEAAMVVNITPGQAKIVLAKVKEELTQ